MKKNNEKGFLLAEAIVVGVFVLSLFTFLFVNVVPLVGKYEEAEKYDTVDGVYNANLVRNMVLEDANWKNVLALGTNDYKMYSTEEFCKALASPNYCKTLLSSTFLNVKLVYVTWYRTAKIKTSSKNNVEFDRAARDYIDSLDGFTQPAGSTYQKYHRLIIYFNDGSFANVEVKISE